MQTFEKKYRDLLSLVEDFQCKKLKLGMSEFVEKVYDLKNQEEKAKDEKYKEVKN